MDPRSYANYYRRPVYNPYSRVYPGSAYQKAPSYPPPYAYPVATGPLAPEPAEPVDPADLPPEPLVPEPLPPNPTSSPVIVIQPTSTGNGGGGLGEPINITVNLSNDQKQTTRQTNITFCDDCCEDVCENVCFFCCFARGRGKVDADPGSDPLLKGNGLVYQH